MQTSNEWSPEECSKKMLRDGLEEHTIEQYIDSINKEGRTFSLYYFVKDQTFENPDKPTVLFAAGGPGQMILASTGDNFVDMMGYRVIYFHLRGTGFSQLPRDAGFDRYIRTDYVVEDVEKIRRDFLGDEKWAAVIGHSYGTVVAHSYAHRFPEGVKKLVLSAPITPVCSLDWKGAARGSLDETKHLDSLRRIYETDFFDFLNDIYPTDDIGPIRDYLVSRGEHIVNEIDRLYWNVQFVGDEYTRLEPELREYGLDLGAPFFGALRRLRHSGWLSLDLPMSRGADIWVVDVQRLSGLIIANGLLRKLPNQIDLRAELKKQKHDATGKKKIHLARILKDLNPTNQSFGSKSSQNTSRPYYLISIYDGLNVKILRELKRESDLKKAIKLSGGERGSNPSLDKVTVVPGEIPNPWNPANRKHGHSTLILKGGADPINELGQAEYYFDHALTGERALLEFPGVGHAMALPEFLNDGAEINQIRIQRNRVPGQERLGPREALIHKFIEKKHADFKRAATLTEIESAIESALARFKTAPRRPKRPGRPSNLRNARFIKKFQP